MSKDAGCLMSYRRLRLSLLCLRLCSCGNAIWLVFNKILDFGAGYYGCHTTDATTLAVNIENLMIYLFVLCCIKAWSIGTLSSSLSPLTPSLYACLQHCGVIPSGAYQPPLGNRLQVLNLQQGRLRPFRVLPAPTPVQEDVH